MRSKLMLSAASAALILFHPTTQTPDWLCPTPRTELRLQTRFFGRDYEDVRPIYRLQPLTQITRRQKGVLPIAAIQEHNSQLESGGRGSWRQLRLLAKLPVDTLKSDKSFVQSIADTPNVATLVSTVVTLARAFNMKTIAEGVETPEQLHKLRQMRCDQAQGYLFSRPVPAADVPSVISRLESAQSTIFNAFSNPADSTR